MLDNYHALQNLDLNLMLKPFNLKLDLNPLVLPHIPVMDPGKLQLKKLFDQTRETLDLKRLVDFQQETQKSLYEVAPIDTWGIFVWKREELLAIKMVQTINDVAK